MCTSISKRIIKPKNCTLAFGVPTSEEEFMRDQYAHNKDFAKKYNGIRQRYVKEFLNTLRKTEPMMADLGAKIIHRFRLNDFEAQFHDDMLHVIIVFSHWKNDLVEFFDGFATAAQILEKIPADFVGIIDWCVCWPEELVASLRKERPKCLFRFANTALTPFLWLYFYLALFKLLAENELNYFDALEKVVHMFFRTTKSGKRKI